MFKLLLIFEWNYQKNKWPLYVITIAFLALGVLVGAVSGISFSNIHVNSPYQVAYLVGILSLAGIFAATIIVAQSVLREKDFRFDVLIFSTPVNKLSYLAARFSALALFTLFALFTAVAGLYIGNHFADLPESKFGPFNLLNYIRPFLIFIVPNMLLCLALLCSAAWLTGSKLIVYITGLFTYVLYILGAVFSNSPMIAGSAPADTAKVSFYAKADPFGLAAFFEQTRYLTADQRNTLALSLTGDLLLNRLIWIFIAMALLAIAFFRYNFRETNTRRKIDLSEEEVATKAKLFHPVAITDVSYGQTFLSFWRLNVLAVFRSLPFLLVLVVWTVLLSVELSSAVSGNPRTGAPYATSILLFNVIRETLPTFCLLVMLFFSSELLWKSRDTGFHSIEYTTPYKRSARLMAIAFSIACLPVFLIAYSSLLAIGFQILNAYSIVSWTTYGLLFYYTGMSLVINALLMVAVQTSIRNKYAGLALATLFILVSSTSIGQMLGLRYPLFRLGGIVGVPLSEMSGFDAYANAFHWQMLYSGSLVLALLFIHHRRSVAICFAVICFGAAFNIYYHTSVASRYRTEAQLDDWKQAYELRYKHYEEMPQPTITNVRTSINLYGSRHSYEVSGEYELLNKHNRAIDSVLVYVNPETTLQSLNLEHSQLLKADAEYGHYWYVFKKPLTPGSSCRMKFRFRSGWSGFKQHEPFNSILANGSFIRISTYFPVLGYKVDNELSSEIKRRQRGLQPQPALKKLELAQANPYDYAFINYEAFVSTDGNQTAITSGNLTASYEKGGRSYFHYKSDRPMPFRFAVSSAAYQVAKSRYKNIPVEVYYEPNHGRNVARLISNAKSTLAYCEQNFGSYPHAVLRFAEVSSFATGFSATSYPSAVYMKEDGGFFNDIRDFNDQDVINELAGHELSHQWWGSTGFAPEYKEGGWVLTETLAKYTELMLYRKSNAKAAVLENIRTYLDLYLSERSFSKEVPLYKTSYETPHIPYDKGMLVMYQLAALIGEDRINNALKSLYNKHRFPMPPPETTDLIAELYTVSAVQTHAKIDELFKQVITYDTKVETARLLKTGNKYQVQFTASLHKYREDGQGKRVEIKFDPEIEVGLVDGNGHIQVYTVRVNNTRLRYTLITATKPASIIVDPDIKNIDTFIADNKKTL
jgi:ABC-2 type transport system permease protein